MQVIRTVVLLTLGLLLPAGLHADGIALSTDGLRWTFGIGAYGTTGLPAPRGMEVAQGGTLYIKYFSERTPDVTLKYSRLQETATKASPIGPPTGEHFGSDPSRPIELRITDIGTPKAAVRRISGVNQAENWGGFFHPGIYNLHLADRLDWLHGPLVITEKAKPPTILSRVLGWLGLGDESSVAEAPSLDSGSAVANVPDAGAPAVLLGLAVIFLAMVRPRHRR